MKNITAFLIVFIVGVIIISASAFLTYKVLMKLVDMQIELYHKTHIEGDK